jgi:hypothetical protein
MYGMGGFASKVKAEFIRRGLMSHKEFLVYEAESERSHKTLVETLYASKRIPESDLIAILSSCLGYPPINLSLVALEMSILEIIPKELIL